MSHLANYRRHIFSAPANRPGCAEERGGVLNPREVLVWRRSG
jgi:hypothetical protein